MEFFRNKNMKSKNVEIWYRNLRIRGEFRGNFQRINFENSWVSIKHSHFGSLPSSRMKLFQGKWWKSLIPTGEENWWKIEYTGVSHRFQNIKTTIIIFWKQMVIDSDRLTLIKSWDCQAKRSIIRNLI